MLYQANMPKCFWAEAITTAAYILNRLPSDSVDGIPYELWHGKSLTAQDLKSIKPFGCIVHANVPKKRRKHLGKVDTRSTTGCFIGYTGTDKMHKIWDFERKCFVNSHDLICEETQFPEPSDFDEPPADAYTAYRHRNVPHVLVQPPTPEPPLSLVPRSPPSPVSIRDPTPEPTPAHVSQLLDEIVVQPPPALQVFMSYGEFQPDNDPVE